MGSASLDKLSLKVNKELNLATADPATVAALPKQIITPDFRASREIVRLKTVTSGVQLAEIMVDELL